MFWGPFALALALGLIVSAGIYVAYRWPEDPAPEPPRDGASDGNSA